MGSGNVCLWVSCCCSITKSCQTLQSRELQYARLPCPLLSPRVSSDSYPLSQWCHPTISSSVTPSPLALNLSQHQCLFQCPQSFPASVSFPMSQLFVSDGQSIGASASTLVLPMNIQGWFPLRLTEWVSVCIKTIQEKNNQVLHSLENNWLIN